jgi:hypothetical protein
VISEVSSSESFRDLLELEGVELSSASGTDWLELLDEREKDDGNVAGGLMGWADSTGSEVVEVDVDIASVAAAFLEDWVIAVAGLALRSTICFVSTDVGSGLSCLTGWAAASLSQACSGRLERLLASMKEQFCPVQYAQDPLALPFGKSALRGRKHRPSKYLQVLQLCSRGNWM